MTNSIQRVLTGIVLVPAVLGVVLYAPQPLFAGIAAGIALLVLHEFLDLAEKYGCQPLRTIAFPFAVAIVILPIFEVSVQPLGILVLIALSLVMLPSRPLEKSLTGAAATVLGVAYTALPFSQLVAMRRLSSNLVIYLLVVVWVGDTAAYYAGRSFGRNKLASRISPGKTWEGTIASLVVATFAGHFFLVKVFHVPILQSFLVSIAVNVAAQIGDLAESALKRGADVKDSGTLLPGHGGLLDRVDALLFAIPVLWYHVYWVLGPYL